ncbi:MAG: cyclic nucleotide-binding domain-containing protein [Candidatus Cloacimonetes bacterium]|nr:cyclic nucleotide-binding domain-containing protein [Candidatus Cloacimonadota bacterium]
MKIDDRIVATVSMMLTSGGLDDMIGEVGRLVATTDKEFRGKGLFTDLIRKLTEMTNERVQFLMGEARTPHRGSQRILEELSWVAVGFEPMKYLLDHRESVILYAKTQGMAKELRKNNPRVISEVSVLAQTALKNMGFPVDIIVEDEVDGYPIGKCYNIEHLEDQTGISSLLRIERGRISSREIFGNFSLSHGFFRISDPTTNYLIARQGDAILGAIGFSHDPIDKKIRIFELIEFDDEVKGCLLANVEKIAREEFKVDYIEVDISAYSPKIQRTLERLGFVPVVYCPSMVFHNVERLDVIRMVKICCVYEPGTMRLLDTCQVMKDIVEQGFKDRIIGMEITENTRKTELFRDLTDGDLYHIARISHLKKYDAGSKLLEEGSEPDNLYILIEGKADVITKNEIVGKLKTGMIFGEMALIDKSPRSADVVLTTDCTVIEFEILKLEKLMNSYPRLGYAVATNLARSLSTKLQKINTNNLFRSMQTEI